MDSGYGQSVRQVPFMPRITRDRDPASLSQSHNHHNRYDCSYYRTATVLLLSSIHHCSHYSLQDPLISSFTGSVDQHSLS